MSDGGFKIADDKFVNVDFEDALEQTGFGKYNAILIIVCGLVLFGVNSESYGVGYVLPSVECDFHLDIYTKGVLTSANLIGVTGSCCFWGYLSDTKGRRLVLAVSLLLGTLCSVIGVFTPSFWGVTILRLCNGIFIGGPSSIIFAYFGEFQSRLYRSTAMAWMSLSVAFAFIFLPALAWLLLTLNIGPPLNSWRLFMLLVSIPNLLAALAIFKLPESPRYLYHSGHTNQALQVMQRIYTVNTGKSKSHFPVESLQEKVLLVDTADKSMLRDFLKQIVPLFMPPHLKYTLAGGLMQAGIFAVSGGLLLWYSDILNKLSQSDDGGSLTVCQALRSVNTNQEIVTSCVDYVIDDEVFIQNMLIGIGYLISYVSWGFVVKILGNRNFFGACMLISAISLVLLNFLTQKIVIDVLFVAILALPGISVAVINLITVEMIPTHLAAMAVCVSMSAGRIGGMVSSSIVGIMLEWQCEITFSLYAVSLLGTFLHFSAQKLICDFSLHSPGTGFSKTPQIASRHNQKCDI